MKFSTALILGISFLIQGSAFAASATGGDASVTKKTIAYDTSGESTQAMRSGSSKGCKDGNCEAMEAAKSCGAYVSNKNFHGYGFGPTKAAATSKALEMCGPNGCQVVVAECED